MILIVGKNDFIAYSEVEFLTMIGNLLSLEPFKLVDKVIIVDFKDKLSLDQSLLDDFIWIPYEHIEKIDMDEKQKIEQIINHAEIVSSDKLTDSEFVEKLRGEFVRFYEYFFPIEFIDLYKKITRANRKLIIFEDGEYIDNPDRAELFIRQIEKVKPIYDGFIKEGKSVFKFVALALGQLGQGFSKEKRDVEFPIKFVDYLLDLLHKNDKKYKDIFSSSNSSAPYSKLAMQRVDFLLEITSTQKRGESDQKFAKELAQDIKNSELFTAMIEYLGLTKPREIDEFYNHIYESITKEPSQEQRIIIATAGGEILRKNLASIVPEYLFEMLKNQSRELFEDLKDANSRITIASGDDLDFIKYLVSDALRDYSNNSKQYLNALDGLDFSNINKDFLVIEGFESLEYKDQERLWEELLKYQDNFKSAIFCCNKKSKLKWSILHHPGIKRVEIPSYEVLKEERYKIFLHLLNRKQPIDRKTFEIFAALPFHFHEFDAYLDGVESFPIMVNTLGKFEEYMEEFTYFDLSEPFFWYSFEIYHEKAKKAAAEEIKTEMANIGKNENYRIECREKSWEIYQGQRHILQLQRSKGYDLIFYLIKYKENQKEKNRNVDEDEQEPLKIDPSSLYFKVEKEHHAANVAKSRMRKNWTDAKKELAKQISNNSEFPAKKAFIKYLKGMRISMKKDGVEAEYDESIQIEVELGNYFEI